MTNIKCGTTGWRNAEADYRTSMVMNVAKGDVTSGKIFKLLIIHQGMQEKFQVYDKLYCYRTTSNGIAKSYKITIWREAGPRVRRVVKGVLK
ncbi:hypothetical protein Zmor_019257 [Zophobas morio]|uniref:Uncharacterized protein n=1 Tax=Zophobas morio TaxID=2755281 RepID=A0AA38M8N8_9CUCU|nr:hypothetical protein Zmor_019257 [Zophobas morio]